MRTRSSKSYDPLAPQAPKVSKPVKPAAKTPKQKPKKEKDMKVPRAGTMDHAAKVFFSSPHFAVAGASSDPSKFGNRIFRWYLSHSLPAVPLNPRSPSVDIASKSYPTTASPSKLPSPKETSLSVITPPKITMELLKEAKEAGIAAVWLQPGAFDDSVLEFAKEAFPERVVAGYEGGTVGGEGWCVLVDGEKSLRDAGRGWKMTKL